MQNSLTKKSLRKLTGGVIVSFLLLVVPVMASAITIVPECARGNDVPGLECVLETFANIAQLVLALTGTAALVMFVYGGFLMVSSGGVDTKVNKGKDVIKAAVIGIAIVLLAGYLVRYGLSQLEVDPEAFKNVPAEESKGGTTPTEKPATDPSP